MHYTTWKAPLPNREVYYRDAKVCNNDLKEDHTRAMCVCQAREVCIKISMKKNGIQARWRLLAVFHLVPLCVLEEELIGWLACGWLLSDVVGGHYTNATKQTQTVHLFKLIIVLVSLRVQLLEIELNSNFYFKYTGSYKSCPGRKKLWHALLELLLQSYFRGPPEIPLSQASGKPPRHQTGTVTM